MKNSRGKQAYLRYEKLDSYLSDTAENNEKLIESSESYQSQLAR